jgi:hypothetical protein
VLLIYGQLSDHEESLGQPGQVLLPTTDGLDNLITRLLVAEPAKSSLPNASVILLNASVSPDHLLERCRIAMCVYPHLGDTLECTAYTEHQNVT